MSDIIDKVVDKAKDVKDKVVDTTKDVIDATKDSISSSPSSSQSSFSQSYEKNYKEVSSAIETKGTEVPLYDEHTNEESLALVDTKLQEPTTNPAAVATPTNPAISVNQVNQKNNSYKENNEFFNPFLIGIKLWQNYSAIWMDFYKEILNYNTMVMRKFRN
ncbi:MAG: hypothetical protein H0X03_07200 [Nitrosopumilus sp.]|nr:hypothetical protein [Nitrosopumilus sp.]